MRVFAGLLLLGTFAVARPQVERGAVMNAASLLPAGLPGAALSPDGLFVIRGKQLGLSATAAQPAEALGGVTVEISVGGRIWYALLQEVGPTLIRAAVPAGIAYGPAAITVAYAGQRSDAVDTRVVPASVGLFSLAHDGGGPASEFAVRRGQRVTLPVTGLGERPSAARLEVFVGGRAASNVRAEGSKALAFDVPKDAVEGCNVPVQVRTNGSIPSNVVTLRLETEGTLCAQQDRVRNALGLQQAATAGYAIPFRLRMLYELAPGEKSELVGDALVSGIRSGRLPATFGNVLYPPAAGTCSLYAAAGSLLDLRQSVTGGLLEDTSPLDAGAWTIARADGAIITVVPRKLRGSFDYGELGGSLSREGSTEPLFLRPGLFTVAAKGGADIQPFSLLVRFPEPVVWSNRGSVETVNRSRDLEIKWTGGTDDLVVIAGVNIDSPSHVTAGFLCLAPLNAQEFKIPSLILQSLTPSRGRWDDSMGYIVVGALPDTDVLAPVADGFLGVGAAFDGRMVRFQ